MKHKTLRLVTYKEDPSEQVIWNQERPIAYLNRGDATIDEFIELENLIQNAPELLEALEATLETLACWKLECPYAWDDGDENAVAQATEAIRKAKEKP